MKHLIVFPFLTLLICLLNFLTCTDTASTQPPPSIHSFAFIAKRTIDNPTFKDTANYIISDTIHPGDSLQFVGFAVPSDSRISKTKWDFGDGQSGSDSMAIHAYRSGGIYKAVYSIFDRMGNIVMDTVFVFANTPPDSVKILSPANGATNTAFNPMLEWKGYDRDYFDTNLAYLVIVLRNRSVPDTIVRWNTVTNASLNIGLTFNEPASWFVMAKDRFGDTVRSETFHFTTMQNSAVDSSTPLTSPPTGIIAIGISTSSIRISWNELEGVNSFTIQKSRQLSGGFLKIGVLTGNVYIDTGLDSGTTCYYRVSASNSKGTTDYSAAVPGTSFIKATITNQPQSQGAIVGTKVIFTIVAAGVPTPTYQWQKNGTDIPQTTFPSCTTAAATSLDNNAKYRCIVSNFVGKDTSDEATLLVDTLFTKPFIISQPHDTTVTSGMDLAVWIRDTGSYLNVRWRKNSAEIAQAVTCTLSLRGVKTTDAGTYTVKVYNTSDSVVSLPFKIKVLPQTPSAPSALARSALSIGVSWTQTEGASRYRVLRSSGANAFASICTTSQISVVDTPLIEGATYSYRIIAGNNDGESDTSVKTICTTFQGPVINKQPLAQKIIVGQNISLSVEATGNPACSYQWKKNGNNIDGATSSTFSLTNATTGDSGDYQVTVSNAVRAINSSSVHVYVLPTFTLTTTCSPSIGGTVTKIKDTTTYIFGDTIRIKAHTTSGYRFTGWSGDTTATDSTIVLIIRKNRSLFANFIQYYTLTLSTPGNGSLSPAGTRSIDSGASLTILATPNTGYVFSVWRTTSGQASFGDSTKASTVVKLTQGNATVQAIFRVLTFKKFFNEEIGNMGSALQQTKDSGYIFSGIFSGSGGGNNVFLTKTNGKGDSLWTKFFNCSPSFANESMQQTLDGGYIITGGTTSNEVALIKTDLYGNQSSTKIFGATYGAWGTAIQQTNDNGYIIAGSYNTYAGGRDIYLIKTTMNGIEEWQQIYGSPLNDDAIFIQQTNDGGYIICVNVMQIGGGASNIQLVKTKPNGDTLWTRFITTTDQDVGYSTQQTSDGGYIIASGGNSELIKTDGNGNVSWTKSFGRTCYSAMQTSDGGYILCESAGYLIKTNASGTPTWIKTFVDLTNIYSVKQTFDGGYIISGPGSSGTYLIKTDENGNVQ